MNNHELSPLDQATKEMPESLIEFLPAIGTFNTIAFANTASYFVFRDYSGLVHRYPLATHLISGAVALLGIYADKASTYRALNTTVEANEAGIDVDFGEQNRLAKNDKTGKDLLRNKARKSSKKTSTGFRKILYAFLILRG